MAKTKKYQEEESTEEPQVEIKSENGKKLGTMNKSIVAQMMHKSIDGKYEVLPIDKIIDNRNNPRKHFDETELQELVASIKEIGIIQPITERKQVVEFESGYSNGDDLPF